MAKGKYSVASEECDKAEETLNSLIAKRDSEFAKITDKYSGQIYEAESAFKKAQGRLRKLVAAPPVKKAVSKKPNQEPF